MDGEAVQARSARRPAAKYPRKLNLTWPAQPESLLRKGSRIAGKWTEKYFNIALHIGPEFWYSEPRPKNGKGKVMRALIASLILVLAVGVVGCAPSDEAAEETAPAAEETEGSGE